MHVDSAEQPSEHGARAIAAHGAVSDRTVGNGAAAPVVVAGGNHGTGECTDGKLAFDRAFIHLKTIDRRVVNKSEQSYTCRVRSLYYQVTYLIAVTEIDSAERGVGICSDRHPSVFGIAAARHGFHIDVAFLTEIRAFGYQSVRVIIVYRHHQLKKMRRTGDYQRIILRAETYTTESGIICIDYRDT